MANEELRRKVELGELLDAIEYEDLHFDRKVDSRLKYFIQSKGVRISVAKMETYHKGVKGNYISGVGDDGIDIQALNSRKEDAAGWIRIPIEKVDDFIAAIERVKREYLKVRPVNKDLGF